MYLLKALFLAGILALALNTAKASDNESYLYCVIAQTDKIVDFKLMFPVMLIPPMVAGCLEIIVKPPVLDRGLIAVLETAHMLFPIGMTGFLAMPAIIRSSGYCVDKLYINKNIKYEDSWGSFVAILVAVAIPLTITIILCLRYC